MNIYETDKLLSEYLLLHYGGADLIFGNLPGPMEGLNFPQRCLLRLVDTSGQADAALDVGCAVGRSSFELTRFARGVLGVDYSARFIEAANQLRAVGQHDGVRSIEADRVEPFTVEVPAGLERQRARFEVGDACDLREDLQGFDIVFAANLICRLPEPKHFIQRLPYLVRPGGQLILTTPFTWLEEFTPVANWLGRAHSGKTGAEALQELLQEHFVLEHSENLPFVIRETARKFQYTFAWGTRWRRQA